MKSHLFLGDNLTILSSFPENHFQLTVTSPPYDQMRDYKNQSLWGPKRIEPLAQELFRVTKEGGYVVWIVGDQTINGSETFTSAHHAKAFMDAGFKKHDTMLCKKTCFAFPSRNRYHQLFEYMYVFLKGPFKIFNPIKDHRNKDYNDFGKGRRQKDGTMSHLGSRKRIKLKKYGMRNNIWEYATGKNNSTHDVIAFKHPAIFPERLVQDHIYSWSNPQDFVLDPFCGSGTTCKVAHQMSRKYIGIEIVEEYYQIAEKRLLLHQNSQKPLKYYEDLYHPQENNNNVKLDRFFQNQNL